MKKWVAILFILCLISMTFPGISEITEYPDIVAEAVESTVPEQNEVDLWLDEIAETESADVEEYAEHAVLEQNAEDLWISEAFDAEQDSVEAVDAYPEVMAAADSSSVSGRRAISQDKIIIYGGSIVQYDNDYPADIRLTIIEDGMECSGVKWTSSNDAIIQVDEDGNVTWANFGSAVITGTLDGETFRCDVEVRELRMYEYWVYTGDAASNYWMWDMTFCMSVGQTVPYRLEEWTYNAAGNVVKVEDVTQRYPLTAENPNYLNVQVGSVTALKPDSSQEDRTSGVYCELKNDTIAAHQRIRFHVFTGTIESYVDNYSIENIRADDDRTYCSLTSDLNTGYFPLDDTMFIRGTDWMVTRCRPEEFEWHSSNTSIIRFNGIVEGSKPDKTYATAYYDIVGSGTAELSVWYHGVKLASKRESVFLPTPTPIPSSVSTPTPVPSSVSTPTPVPTSDTPTSDTVLPKVRIAKARVSHTSNVGTQFQIDLGGKAAKSFKSSKPNVATVSKTGQVTAKAAGKTKITVKIGKKKRILSLTVKDPTIPTKVMLDKSGTITWYKQDALTLKATIPTGTTSGIAWKTSNKKVASVSGGKLIFKKQGTVTITATATRGKKKAKVKIKVIDGSKASAIKINPPASTTLKVGEKLTLTASANIARPVDPKNPTKDPKAKWTSSNKKVLSVNKTSGEITAKKAGTATITVTAGSKKKARIKITVVK